MFCGHCGQKIPDDSRFCEQCGQPVSVSRRPAATIPAAGSLNGEPATVFFRRMMGLTSSHPYSRIIFWIQDSYGDRFAPSMSDDEVKRQLESIYGAEIARGVPGDMLKGFSVFIRNQKNRMLLVGER